MSIQSSLLANIRKRLSEELRLLISIIYGAGAFITFVLLAYIVKLICPIGQAGAFLAFYSIVYSCGSFASLGLYSRAPSWVHRDCDANGNFRSKRFILSVVTVATLLTVIAINVDSKSLTVNEMPVLVLIAGVLQVSVLMMLCGISNGYGKFHCSRLNFVLIPNLLAFILIISGLYSPFHSLVLALLISNITHLCLVSKLTKWRLEETPFKPNTSHSTWSLNVILPVSILSVLPQVDIWVLICVLESEDIFIYTFYARFLMIPMFSVIAFNNVMYATLPSLACSRDFNRIEKVFLGKYKSVQIITFLAILSLPLAAYLLAYAVGVSFDLRAVFIIISLALGYGTISFFPSYETLAYAFEAQPQVFPFSIIVFMFVLTGVALLSQTEYVWFSPLIPAIGLLLMRIAYCKVYNSIKKGAEIPQCL